MSIKWFIFTLFIKRETAVEPLSTFEYRLASNQQVCVTIDSDPGKVVTFIFSEINPYSEHIRIFYKEKGKKRYFPKEPSINDEIYYFVKEKGEAELCIQNTAKAFVSIRLNSCQCIYTLKDYREVDERATSAALEGFLKSVGEVRDSLRFVVERIEAKSSQKPLYLKLKEALFG